MKLGEQWIEIIDGQEHMVKAVESPNKLCSGCVHVSANEGGDGYKCDSPDMVVGCGMGVGFVIKDLGVLKDGRLPCPFCGEYPNHCYGNGMHGFICWKEGDHNISSRLEKSLQQAIDAWNRRV